MNRSGMYRHTDGAVHILIELMQAFTCVSRSFGKSGCMQCQVDFAELVTMLLRSESVL